MRCIHFAFLSDAIHMAREHRHVQITRCIHFAFLSDAIHMARDHEHRQNAIQCLNKSERYSVKFIHKWCWYLNKDTRRSNEMANIYILSKKVTHNFD